MPDLQQVSNSEASINNASEAAVLLCLFFL